MTHKTKNDKKWICGKSERLWNTFTNTIKDKVGETSTLRNEEGLEVDDGDMERNTTTNGEDEGEKTSEDDVNLLKTVSEEQLLKTWIETVGGTKKGKIYGLGSRNCLLADSKNSNCASSTAQNPSNIPTQQIFETPEFQQLLDHVFGATDDEYARACANGYSGKYGSSSDYCGSCCCGSDAWFYSSTTNRWIWFYPKCTLI
ncbi:uncharacterized protein [Solanum tuberosum]|uniref:uncharacterized protein n=1 Tax=Solanum tuberosum TaxID=4113 RepID=UPI0003D244B0|nr:PREDICTED: uncharacterized protein LOC102595262 [Solanum tuberosum]